MKYIYLVSLLLVLFSSTILAQNIVLQDSVSQEYEESLWSQVAAVDLILENPQADSVTMNAYAKRVVLHMALIYVDSYDFGKDMEEIGDSLENNGDRLDDFFETYLEPINFDDGDSMLIDFRKLFLEPKYSEMKEDYIPIKESFDEDFDSLGNKIESIIEANDDHLKSILDDLEAIGDSEIQFEVSVQIIGAKSEDIMVFHEYDFYDMDSVRQYAKDGLEGFERAIEKLDSLQDDLIDPNDVISSFQEVVTNFKGGLDNLDSVLTTEPLSILEIDASFIDGINDVLLDADSLLDGKEYDLNNNDGKTIRPLALIEQPFEDFWDTLKGFYISENRNAYTFNNLFPQGLTQDAIDGLEENMILNSNDTDEEMDARMRELKTEYLSILETGPSNAEAHFGVAFTMVYFYEQELQTELEDFVDYLDNADFRQDFEWQHFKNSAVADSIADHFEQARKDDDILFTILEIDDGSNGYSVLNTQFNLTYIGKPQLEIMKGLAEAVIETRKGLTDVFNEIDDELNLMFDLDLDPNFLDFSDAETELDVLLVLKQANPSFLNLKQYGIQKFLDAGEDLREAFSRFSTTAFHFKNLADAMAVHEKDLGIDGDAFMDFASDMSEVADDLNNDFQHPDSTVMIDGERVNLSAWFDNPPDMLLQRFIWHFDDDDNTDNTLGGLFPDRGGITNINDPANEIPNKYVLVQNYPNPFNPSTTIKYAMPNAGNVVITIYNVLGQQIETLFNQPQNAGFYKVRWNASSYPAGLYFYKIQSGEFLEIKKALLIK